MISNRGVVPGVLFGASPGDNTRLLLPAWLSATRDLSADPDIIHFHLRLLSISIASALFPFGFRRAHGCGVKSLAVVKPPSPPLERKDADLTVHGSMHVPAARILEATAMEALKGTPMATREVALLLLRAWGQRSSEAMCK